MKTAAKPSNYFAWVAVHLLLLLLGWHSASAAVIERSYIISAGDRLVDGSYVLSNAYIYLSGKDGYFEELRVDAAGAGQYGQNIVNVSGHLDWLINGTTTFSNGNTTIQLQETDRLILNNQAGALWDIRLNGNQFSSSLNLAYDPASVQIRLDLPYEDSGYYDYADRYHWEFNNNHDATDIPFKTFYAQTGNTRTIEYFMRNEDVLSPGDDKYRRFRTNLLGDPAHVPSTGMNRLIAIGVDGFDLDFNHLPSHSIWVEKTSDTLTLCSGQATTARTVNFDFVVTRFDENEDIEINEHGDRMPYFYTSLNETITNLYGGVYTFDELLNRLYRQGAFFYTDVGLNIWQNWAAQYTGFVNNWYRAKVKTNLNSWHQGDDGYGRPGYMWTWIYDPGQPDLGRGSPVGGLNSLYDTRHLNTNALFIQAAWEYYAWTGDQAFLNGLAAKLDAAMDYQLDALIEGSDYIIDACSDQGSDHRGIHGEDVLSNYWDLLPFGGRDGYASIDFYNSLLAMAQIKYAMGEASAGDAYSSLAEQARLDYNSAFWSTATGRYIGAVDCDANPHDFGFTFVNILAAAAGLPDTTQAETIYMWLDSAVGDIYSRWKFAPRSNDSSTRNLWRRIDANHYQWDEQIQDGGANLFVSGYDVLARALHLGADNAYARLRALLQRYSEPDKLTGGSPTIFNETIQGGTDGPGALGVMSHEFPESGMAGASFLYAFVGLDPKWDGLHISPRLPTGQEYLGAKNINYRGMTLDFHITDSNIQITCTKDESTATSYYVIAGKRKAFPTGTFVVNEPAVPDPNQYTDVDGDGDFDGSDLAGLAAQFGDTTCPCSADLNGDGRVDGEDMEAFSMDFGSSSEP